MRTEREKSEDLSVFSWSSKSPQLWVCGPHWVSRDSRPVYLCWEKLFPRAGLLFWNVKQNQRKVESYFQSCRIISISVADSSNSHAVWLKKKKKNLLLGEVSPTCSHTESRAAPVTPVKPVEASVPAAQTPSCRTWCVPQRTDTLSFSAWCSWTPLKCPDHLDGNKESNEKSQLRIQKKNKPWKISELLTAVVFDRLILDHGESVPACHHVGRQHHRVNRLVLHWFVLRDSALSAEDVQAPHTTPWWLGEVELYVEPCWKYDRGGNCN